jgi:hypothetical protein
MSPRRKLTKRLGSELVDELIHSIVERAISGKRFFPRPCGSIPPSPLPTSAAQTPLDQPKTGHSGARVHATVANRWDSCATSGSETYQMPARRLPVLGLRPP